MSISYDEVAYLLRRAGFGGSPEEIDSLRAQGREGAVEYLLNYEGLDNQAMDEVMKRFPQPHGGNTPTARWMARLVVSRRQFEEKMTLFW